MDKFKSVYKFRSMNVNSLSTLANKKIWFSSQDNLNDPFEGIVNIVEPSSQDKKIARSISFSSKVVEKQSALTAEQARNVVIGRYLENPNDFLEFVGESLDRFKNDLGEYQSKLGIFSTAADIPSDPRTQVANMLLWSHYGDEFKGFCVKYDLEALHESLIKNNPESKFAWTKVGYVDRPHSIDIFDDADLSAMKFLKSIQCKHEQWGYECEVRLISTTTGLKSFSAEAISAIFIGERMPTEQQSLLMAVVEHSLPNTEIYRVTTDRNNYAISINKI